MIRQVRYRDRECRFPGCGSRRFTEAHHIVWWRDGGRTDLDNLLLICSFHHRLVHEHGWSLRRHSPAMIAARIASRRDSFKRRASSAFFRERNTGAIQAIPATMSTEMARATNSA